MPKFMIERIYSAANLPTPADREYTRKLTAERFNDLLWHQTHVIEADERGDVRAFCIYSAPSEQRLREHAAMIARHDVVAIYEIRSDISPDLGQL